MPPLSTPLGAVSLHSKPKKKSGGKKKSLAVRTADPSHPTSSDAYVHQAWGPQIPPQEFVKQRATEDQENTPGGDLVDLGQETSTQKNLPEISPSDSISNVGVPSTHRHLTLKMALLTSRTPARKTKGASSTLSVRNNNTPLEVRPAKSILQVSNNPSHQTGLKSIDLSRPSRQTGAHDSSSSVKAPTRVTLKKKSPLSEQALNNLNNIEVKPFPPPVEKQVESSVSVGSKPVTTFSKREKHMRSFQKGNWGDSESEADDFPNPHNSFGCSETQPSTADEVPDPREFVDIPGLWNPIIDMVKKRAAEKTKTNFGYDDTVTAISFVEHPPSSNFVSSRKSSEFYSDYGGYGGHGGGYQGYNGGRRYQPLSNSEKMAEPVVENFVEQPAKAVVQEPLVEIKSAPLKAPKDKAITPVSHSPMVSQAGGVTVSKATQVNYKDMDWEIKWKTTSSFKTIRPRVSNIDSNFTPTLDNIRDILEGNSPFLPSHKRYELEGLEDFQFQSDSAYGSQVGSDYSSSTKVHPSLETEGNRIAAIVACSNATQGGTVSEREVHQSVLRHAFDTEKRVVIQDLDHAQICYQYLVDDSVVVAPTEQPMTKASYSKLQSEQELLQGFAIGLLLNADNAIRRNVKQYIKRSEVPTISPSMYRLLRMTPVGIFVASSGVHDAVGYSRSRLSVWAASWFKRMDSFRADPSDTPVPRLPVLPIISAESDIWRLYFACRDTPSSVEIVGPVTIGSTSMVQDAYKLVAVLRVIDEWLNETFVTWLAALVDLEV